MRIAIQTLSTFAVFIAALIACSGVAANETGTKTAVAEVAPRDVVASATLGIINELNKLQPEQRTEEEVRRLVQTYIVPAIDQEKIAMGALGKYWRRADPEQRQAFIDRFRELQIRTYSGAFKAFNGEQFEFDEARFNDSGDKALVKGTLKQNNGNTIPVDFRLYRDKDSQEWRIYDAVIAGLGMVKTYREQLSERLQNISMNELLAELSAQDAN
jgi:ABC-type transporter MlaC component